MKRIAVLITAVLLSFSLCACGSIYDRDYFVVEDYVSEPQPTADVDSVTVKRYSQLKNSIMELVLCGEESGSIVFDANYNGDPAEDMASACWELRSRNALCAYCVENIAYELSRIVTYYEANINVSYADSAVSVEDVTHLNYAYELIELVNNAMDNGEPRLAALVESGYYSAEDVQNAVSQHYFASPAVSLTAVSADVTVYSGNAGQKLYEIEINYGAAAEDIAEAKQRLSELNAFAELETDNMSEGEMALAACEYLADNCEVTNDGHSSAYDALLNNAADSEGIALAYVELCRELGLKCQAVYGQFDWSDHYWNIVEIAGEKYHVDVSACIQHGVESGFLFSDNDMWGSYRWDIASYPKCVGELTLRDISENF